LPPPLKLAVPGAENVGAADWLPWQASPEHAGSGVGAGKPPSILAS